MTVSKSGLKAALETFFTPPSKGGTLPQDEDPTDHQKACAALWADAMQTYVAGAFPGPSPAIMGTASANLQTALEGVFAGWYALDDYPPDDCAAINAAFEAFAAEIFASPVPLYTARAWIGLTPPTPPIDFCTLGTGDDYSAAADNFANLIDSWFTTGISKTSDDNPPSKPPLTETWS
jgi:hypothetical protein